MWLERTYWVEANLEGQRILQAITLDEGVEAFIPAAFAARKHPSCSACFAQTACMDSIWGDGGRMGGPTDTFVSTAFTCQTCRTPYFQVPYGQSPVAGDCPRLALNREARECHRCRTKRPSLRLVRG